MSSVTAKTCRRTKQAWNLAGGIDTGARAEINASGHHILLKGRIFPER
jgi:hypothetical protein